MTVKEYLNQVHGLEISINILEKEIERLEADLVRISGIDYSRPRVDSSPQPDSVSAAAMDEIERTKQRRVELIKRKHDVRTRVIDQIDGMPHDLFRSILHGHYIEMLAFKDIAEREHYSVDYIIHAHGWALQEFERLYHDDME